jgi:hypothetical protein
MTFNTDPAAALLTDQQITVIGTMGIMTTGTGKRGAGSPGVFNVLKGMILHGVPVFNILQRHMAAHT